jgi:hypothetical protein
MDFTNGSGGSNLDGELRSLASQLEDADSARLIVLAKRERRRFLRVDFPPPEAASGFGELDLWLEMVR